MRRGSWVLLLVLAALVGLLLYLDRKERTSGAETVPTSSARRVFGEDAGAVVSIEIRGVSGEVVRVARDPDQIWAIELPMPAPANQGLAESAATQASSLRLVAEVQGGSEIFGLDAPVYQLGIGFASGAEHRLEIGSETPTSSGYYARLDGNKLLVVGLEGLNALLGLLTAPPYIATPTPYLVPATATAAVPSDITPTSIQTP